jgi:hypothetical protein
MTDAPKVVSESLLVINEYDGRFLAQLARARLMWSLWGYPDFTVKINFITLCYRQSMRCDLRMALNPGCTRTARQT